MGRGSTQTHELELKIIDEDSGKGSMSAKNITKKKN